MNLASRLRESLPAEEWDLLQRVADAAAKLQLPLYAVGGLPRDLLLRKRGSDFDLVVEGSASTLAKSLATRYGGKITVHRKFGTAKWSLRESRFEVRTADGGHPAAHLAALDFVSARSESYRLPAALPTVNPGSIDDDLARRDFTINAMAIRLDGAGLGELRDDFHGLEDLEHGVIRVLHDESFVDDPTRMYRAVRYEQRYEFRIDDRTLALMSAGRGLVEKLSAQRIRHELDLILDEPRAEHMLARLGALNLLKPIHSAFSFDEAARVRLARSVSHTASLSIPHHSRRELRWMLWLMAEDVSTIDSIYKRLHFGAELHAALRAAAELLRDLGSLKGALPSAWVQRLEDVPVLATFAVYLGSEPGAARNSLEQYLTRWRSIRPITTGHDLRKLGLKPGPKYRSILGELQRARLDGQVKNDEEERDYLLRLVQKA